MKKSAPAALITGASRRVGRHIALHLAKQGFNLAIHCRKEDKDSASLERELAALGVKHVMLTAELSKPAQLEKLVEKASARLGTLSCLINNAAMFEKDNLSGLKPERFNEHMAINVYAPMALIRDFAAQAKPGRDNTIITILDSCVGLSISPNYLTYAMSRNAMDYFTQLMARELAPHIRINAVSAGLTLAGKKDKKGSFERLAKKIPLQRTSSPEEVCRAVDFILQSPSLTGEIIALSGGLHL